MDNQKETVLQNTLRYASKAMAVYTSEELEIGFINQAMLRVLSGSGHETYFSELVPELSKQILSSLLTDIWQSGKIFHLASYPTRVVRANTIDWVYLDWYVEPILDQHGDTHAMIHMLTEVANPFITVIRKVKSSSELSLDAILEKWNHKLSHDLKNPLSVAKLGMQYMKSRKQLAGAEREKWINMVTEALYDVEKLIADTAHAGRQEVDDSAVKSIGGIPKIFRQILQNNIRVGMTTHRYAIDTLTHVEGDDHLLYQIFSLAIQSVNTMLPNDIPTTVLINSSKSDDIVTYSISVSGVKFGEVGSAFYLLKKLIKALGADVVIQNDRKISLLEINFPIC